jgi:hypothetical protein
MTNWIRLVILRSARDEESGFSRLILRLETMDECPGHANSLTFSEGGNIFRAQNACLGGLAMKRIVFLLLIVILTPGCLILPMGGGEHGQEIACVRSQIAVGLTTRETVISILGEPDVKRDRFILYKNKEYDGGFFVWFGSHGGTRGQVFMDLYFEFDNHGVLTDFRTDKYDFSWKSVKDDEDTSKIEDPCHPEPEEACDPGVESCL